MKDLAALRSLMVERQLASRGIRDDAVLSAMGEVPREIFVAPELVEFAYEDAALPIAEEQTISQPYIVALMVEALDLAREDRVLEVGTGSGYAAAVLSRVVAEVDTIERHESLARSADDRFRRLGYSNIQVRVGDGTLGWEQHAPYNGIIVSAGGPEIPPALLAQLAIGGRLVIPVGRQQRRQRLIRITRTAEDVLKTENLGFVQFVPLIGAAGWQGPASEPAHAGSETRSLPELLSQASEPFTTPNDLHLSALLDRIGNARVVLLGEASHGTAEFYALRARITRELIERRGFNIVAVEADWPDAARIDQYARGLPATPGGEPPFSRFPMWMWANTEVLKFVEWLRGYNASSADPARAVGFYGLDLYSLYTSIQLVLGYLDHVDPDAARTARRRYACLTPWEGDPVTYGAAVINDRYRDCEGEVVAMLRDLHRKRLDCASHDGHRFLDAEQNARLVAAAEKYYRALYYGSVESWNLRDGHMFETLEAVLRFRGPAARAVAWEHNSHVGDASATEMGARGERNIGQLCRRRFGRKAYLVGFGTDHGTVAAATDWDAPMEIMDVRPAMEGSYERLCHETELPAFLLPLRLPLNNRAREQLLMQRLERAIGVVYRPETELQSHYFYAILPRQFDEYIWVDETHAVTPLAPNAHHGIPETFPFGV